MDGILLEGSSSVDESLLTGESRPVIKTEGSDILAGSINHEGSLLIRCSAAGSATLWGRLCQSVRDTLSQPGSTQRMSDQVATGFVPVVLGIANLSLYL